MGFFVCFSEKTALNKQNNNIKISSISNEHLDFFFEEKMVRYYIAFYLIRFNLLSKWTLVIYDFCLAIAASIKGLVKSVFVKSILAVTQRLFWGFRD